MNLIVYRYRKNFNYAEEEGRIYEKNKNLFNVISFWINFLPNNKCKSCWKYTVYLLVKVV